MSRVAIATSHEPIERSKPRFETKDNVRVTYEHGGVEKVATFRTRALAETFVKAISHISARAAKTVKIEEHAHADRSKRRAK